MPQSKDIGWLLDKRKDSSIYHLQETSELKKHKDQREEWGKIFHVLK